MTDETSSIVIETNVAPAPAPAPLPAALVLGPKDFAWGTGRRKTSVARVRMRPGSGSFLVNGRPMEDYFPVLQHRIHLLAPLEATGAIGRYDVFVNVNGGGPTGQAGAVRLGIARALRRTEPEVFDTLREGGFLTRDSRMVERKKYGQRKARRRYQFSKR